MLDKINIDLDESFIKKLFELTDAVPPAINEIDLIVIKKQLHEVGVMLNGLKEENEQLKSAKQNKKTQTIENTQKNDTPVSNEQQQEIITSSKINLSDYAGNVSNVQKASEMAQLGIPLNYNQPTLQFIEPSSVKLNKKQYYDDNGHPVKGKILIIDDLGIITYQLSFILKKAGYLPITSKEIYDAVDKYKRSSFDYVIMDLFIPTEREGFILLEELKKIAEGRNEIPIIAVMSASTRKDHKQECQKKGAAFYVEKQDDWQKELFGLLLQYQ